MFKFPTNCHPVPGWQRLQTDVVDVFVQSKQLKIGQLLEHDPSGWSIYSVAHLVQMGGPVGFELFATQAIQGIAPLGLHAISRMR
jgi:hypothetical protein